MRASPLLAALAAAAGCGGATAIDVTVTFDEMAHRPDALQVTVRVDGMALEMDARVTAPGGRALKSGDDFVVLMPDALDGKVATVEVVALQGATPGPRGAGQATVARGRKVGLTIPLGECAPGCADGMATVCSDGGVVRQPCAYGCEGAACRRGDTCAAPADVSARGTFAESTAGLADDANGSCRKGSADAVTSLTLAGWSTVTFDTAGSPIDTILYTRAMCADASSELPLAGPCPGAIGPVAGTSCSDDEPMASTSRLVECGLPPGTYFTWIDSKGAEGPYSLAVTATPVSLNACAEAGNLLAGGTFTATTAGHADAFGNTGNNSCFDDGQGAPDAIFFFALTARRNVTLTAQGMGFRTSLYVRSACNSGELDCAIGSTNNPSRLTLNGIGPGLFYVIVDGVNGASGPFTITYAIN